MSEPIKRFSRWGLDMEEDERGTYVLHSAHASQLADYARRLSAAEGERDALADSLDMAKEALPAGFTVDAEHNLHECVEALGKDRNELLQSLAGTAGHAEGVASMGKPPCDCIKQDQRGAWHSACYCSNIGDAQDAAVWATERNAETECQRMYSEAESIPFEAGAIDAMVRGVLARDFLEAADRMRGHAADPDHFCAPTFEQVRAYDKARVNLRRNIERAALATMKRFNPWDYGVEEDPRGEYVLHADHEAANELLRAEVERLTQAQRAFEHEVYAGRNEQHDKLVVERDTLRAALARLQARVATLEAALAPFARFAWSCGPNMRDTALYLGGYEPNYDPLDSRVTGAHFKAARAALPDAGGAR